MTGDGTHSFKYDAENRLTPITWTYSYDGDNHRVETSNGTTTTYYWYDNNFNVIATTGNVVRDYVYFNGRRIGYESMTSGNQHYFWSDHLGSPQTITNSNGSTIQWDSDYYPFGTSKVLTDSEENFFLFTGYLMDYEIGDYFAENREQSPNLGRFLSPDPLKGRLDNPQSMNRYAYVNNSPTANTDPTGQSEVNQDQTGVDDGGADGWDDFGLGFGGDDGGGDGGPGFGGGDPGIGIDNAPSDGSGSSNATCLGPGGVTFSCTRPTGDEPDGPPQQGPNPSPDPIPDPAPSPMPTPQPQPVPAGPPQHPVQGGAGSGTPPGPPKPPRDPNSPNHGAGLCAATPSLQLRHFGGCSYVCEFVYQDPFDFRIGGMRATGRAIDAACGTGRFCPALVVVEKDNPGAAEPVRILACSQ